MTQGDKHRDLKGKIMRHICTISGKDSFRTAMLLRDRAEWACCECGMSHADFQQTCSGCSALLKVVLVNVVPDQVWIDEFGAVPLISKPNMEYVWHDTGWELPEVYAWIDQVERYLGVSIIRLGDDLTEIVAEQGLLPSHGRRFCTKYAKLKPMRDFLGKQEATLYLGLRADEDDRIQGLRPSKYETFRFPLKEQGIGFERVWEDVYATGIGPPLFYWQWMAERVEELGGRRPDGTPDWVWLPLFSGRSRPNCDPCFYQRTYEWIWLHETHPDLFWAAVQTEESTQHKSPFRWRKRQVKGRSVPSPLVDLLPRAEQIKERRARAIVGYLNRLNTPSLLPDLVQDNPFGATSCGLFCGK